jgi:hypothetical protein
MRARTVSALLYIVPAIAILATWFDLARPTDSTITFDIEPALALLKNGFPFVGLSAAWFQWFLIALPLICLALALAYMSRLSTARVGSVVLVALGFSLAMIAWFTTSHTFGLLIALPIPFGLQAVWSASRQRDNVA